ncbi:MFS transporter [Halopseudomonas pelagia]|uniref:MFS transporter n=1 Tax=Halopseudomonas pelagia TaxID=553151 RepID=UPI0003A90CDA|nr:MFS transporter [Halopseudomonas pelagia]
MSVHSDAYAASTQPEVTARLTVYLVAVGAFALGMASYVTAGLIPMIQTAFTIPVEAAAQLVTAFTLAYGLGSPLIVAFLPGRYQRAGLLAALGLFVLANAASALATELSWLLALRALAGVGSGVYLAMGIAVCATLSPPAKRGKAIAIIMGGMASGTVLGVPLSLLLAERLGWASAFWLVAALGLSALAGLAWRLPKLPTAATIPLGRKLALLADGRVLAILTVSLLAAIGSLGMYTFIAPFLAEPEHGAIRSIAPYLWVWGLGGVAGSFLIGPLADRMRGPALTLAIMLCLTFALMSLPLAASMHPWLAVLPIALWGAVGWALQVPQNNELIRTREAQGDGNFAVALNESALYLGSAIGAAGGGLILLMGLPLSSLAVAAGTVGAVGALVQLTNMRRH